MIVPSQNSCVSNIARSRHFHSSRTVHVDPGPRKLSNILEGGPTPAVQVRGITPGGIELADGLVLPGACVFLDGKVFLWDVGDSEGGRNVKWEMEHFKLFEIVVPKPGEHNDRGTGIGKLIR